VAAVCAVAAPTHLTSLGPEHDRPSSPASLLVGGPLAEFREAAQRASPLSYVSADDPPCLVIHGDRDASIPTAQSVALDAALRAAGVDVDLAPVADVPASGSFMAAERRTLGASPPPVSRAVTAFVRGLADARVAAAVKHFPGIGRATRSTDRSAVEISSTRSSLQADLVPFRAAIGAGVPLVMISNASYPALDEKPAPWSPKVQALLRRELGFGGVTITDALEPAASTRGREVAAVTVLAAQAGIDLLLLTGSEASSREAYERLVRAAEQGKIPRASARASYDRILRLKRAHAGAAPTGPAR